MMILMKRQLLALVLAAMVFLSAPGLALAQREQIDPDAKPNARLEGYAENVKLSQPGSTALTWILLIGLGVICFGVLFKDAKRTHLD